MFVHSDLSTCKINPHNVFAGDLANGCPSHYASSKCRPVVTGNRANSLHRVIYSRNWFKACAQYSETLNDIMWSAASVSGVGGNLSYNVATSVRHLGVRKRRRGKPREPLRLPPLMHDKYALHSRSGAPPFVNNVFTAVLFDTAFNREVCFDFSSAAADFSIDLFDTLNESQTEYYELSSCCNIFSRYCCCFIVLWVCPMTIGNSLRSKAFLLQMGTFYTNRVARKISWCAHGMVYKKRILYPLKAKFDILYRE